MNINNPTTFGTPSLTLSTSNSSGTGGALRADDTILVYDTTVPETIAFAQAAATGSAGTSARRDHDHGMATQTVVASAAEMEAASSTTVYASPGRTQNHPGVAKCWVINAADGESILASYNLDSLTDGGTGNRTYVFDTDFSSINYAAVGSAGYPAGNDLQAPIFGQNVRLAGSIDCLMRSSVSAGANLDVINFSAFFGDQ